MTDISGTDLAVKADALKALRDMRLDKQKETDALHEQEKLLTSELITLLESSNGAITGVAGVYCRIKLKPTTDPMVEDWDLLWNYIIENRATELIQKRVGITAVRDRWDMGDLVPGVVKREYNKLSITKP